MTNRAKYLWFGGGMVAGVLGVGVAAALVVPGVVRANFGGDGGPMGFMGMGGHRPMLMKVLKEIDTDSDKRISLAEFRKAGDDRIADADTDHDGTVSREETIAFIMKRVEAHVDDMRKRFDLDGDGTVTDDEVRDQALLKFGHFDRNQDGYLDRRDMRGHFGGKHGRGDGDRRGWGDGSGRCQGGPPDCGGDNDARRGPPPPPADDTKPE